MDQPTKIWIKASLANDEASTDEELVAHFIKEGNLTETEARQWVTLRTRYLQEFGCDAEPPLPHRLSTFMGYTVDWRLQEFRKALPDKVLEFIPFGSRQGKRLLKKMQAVASFQK